jgi:hypothetical protein
LYWSGLGKYFEQRNMFEKRFSFVEMIWNLQSKEQKTLFFVIKYYIHRVTTMLF